MRRYIILLLITGIVWAQTDFDKLVLKDGTTYFGEYSKIERKIVYFKPQNAFAFQPISIKQVERLELKCGHAIILGGFTFKEYQKKYKKHWKRLGCITKTTILGLIIYWRIENISLDYRTI